MVWFRRHWTVKAGNKKQMFMLILKLVLSDILAYISNCIWWYRCAFVCALFIPYRQFYNTVKQYFRLNRMQLQMYLLDYKEMWAQAMNIILTEDIMSVVEYIMVLPCMSKSIQLTHCGHDKRSLCCRQRFSMHFLEWHLLYLERKM